MRDEVLPRYANTHTESSGTGLQTTRLREDARRIIRDAVGGDDETVVIFAGSGCTGAVDKLVGILGLRIPSALDDRYGLSAQIPPAERPVVFLGPFEHHSNELPWRESIADVVRIPEDGDGHIDLAVLEAELVRHADRPLRIGTFSAASNVTGILSDTRRDLRRCCTGTAPCRSGTSRRPRRTSRSRCTAPTATTRSASRTRSSSARTSSSAGRARPASSSYGVSCSATGCRSCPAAAPCCSSTPTSHRYLDDPAQREEAGTPAIVDSIRAGLVFQLKEAVGLDVIRAHEEHYLQPGRRRLARRPGDRDPRQPRRGAAVDRVVRGALTARALPAPQLRGRAAQRPVRHPVPRRLLVRRPLRPPAARHRHRALARATSARSSGAARASSPAGCG